MIKVLKRIIQKNITELAEIQVYFTRCIRDINDSNLYMLRQATMWAAIVFTAMVILACELIPGYKVTLGHYAFGALIVIFFFVNIYTRTHRHISTGVTRFLCLSFYFLMGICFIMMEILSDSGQPARWFPLVLVVFPVLYIDRQYRYGLQETALVVIYFIMTFIFKEPAYFYRDAFTVVAAYLLSMIISRTVLGIRSEQGLSMAELQRFSSMDKLTKLYNKSAVLNEIKNYLNHRVDEVTCGMSIIDVDDFKQVNDSLGHGGGDLLLEHVGHLLLASFRSCDIIGRFGGDEFIVFMPGMDHPELVELRCRNLQMQLTDFNIGNAVPFSLSIGTIIDEGGHTQDEIFEMADDALYKSKMAGKNCSTSWTVQKNDIPRKPVLVFVTTLGEEKAGQLLKEELDRFEIFTSDNDDKAIQYLSQYLSYVRIVVLEINDDTMAGALVLKYVKNRERFNSIPILAVVRNEEGADTAKALGADEIITVGEPNESFRDAIGRLSGRN